LKSWATSKGEARLWPEPHHGVGGGVEDSVSESSQRGDDASPPTHNEEFRAWAPQWAHGPPPTFNEESCDSHPHEIKHDRSVAERRF
jgi:hypothetical protein